MLTNQIIQNCLEELRDITKVELALYSIEGIRLAMTSGAAPVQNEVLASFADSAAQSQVVGECHLLKVEEEGREAYILTACGNDDNVYMVAKIAVSQIKTLTVAYKERYDRTNYFQNLILDNLLLVDIYNRAKRLHINVEGRRVVFLIETKMEKENGVMEMMRSLFSQQNGDYVVAVDEQGVILIKSLQKEEDDQDIHQVAQMIVDMLNTEAMLKARVAYGTEVNELKELSKSYKEAKMAMDVGRIFDAGKKVISYKHLGIGRLIYQLPDNLCRMFMEEIFGDRLPDKLDEETLITIQKFFENSLNVSETSRQLYIHRNTLVYRIEKLQKETGLDIRNFDDALTFKIALMVVSYLNFLSGKE
ncbi:MAG: helix-turn-helix domain-containing protein [Lachnospiraceae bacterium]|nr:helix-turn-helix domain-containing protein [Lachnospiraceae bacterium]